MVCRTLGVWAMVFAVIGVWPRATRAQTSLPKPAASADQPSTRGAAATLDRKISLHLEHVTFKQALDAIAAAGHVQIAYSRTYVSSDKLVTLVVDSITVGDALTVLLRGTQISVTVSPGGLLMLDDAADTAGGGRVLSLTAAAVARTDSGSVTGTITDSVTGAGVRGAIARVDETNQMAMTNANGVFTIAPVAAGKYHVSIRRVGFLPHVRLIVVEGGKQTVVDVILSRQATKLDEVLTTATGSQRRLEVGNDITTLSADSILNIAPATNLTQLLETRVPGLVVQNTTGIPGAPSRLRLRGVSSIEQSDDPILIVDGIRVYSNQSGSYNAQGGNLTNGGSQVVGRVNTPNGNSLVGNQGYYGPSPIDLIDPNSIESIEVMKGPSAAALYGSDAGNGVIIIKTKRGVAGQTRWNLSGNETIETLPGDWPVNYFRFGHASGLDNVGSQVCSLYDGPQNCTTDSLVAFQALNNPRLSPLGTGSAQEVALGVSGGAGPLTFAAGGDASQTSGILHLPEIEVQRFDKYHPFPAPGWMINPDQYGTWAAHDNLTVQLGHSAGSPSLSMTSSVMKANQQQSSLQTAIAQLENSYIDSTTLASNPLIDEYYERAQLASLKYTNALSLSNWAPVKWLPITATVGLDVYDTYNTSLTPYGYVLNSSDSLGHYAVQQGQNVVATYNLGTTILTKYVNLSTGFNVQSTTTNTLSGFSTQLTPGVSVPQSFACGGSGGCVSDLTSSLSTYGWYIQPALRPFGRLFVNPAVRLDGGNASGANAQISFYPKIDASYLAIDDRNNRAVPWITQLRPRIAFGIAGVQPGPAEKLRLFQTGTVTSLDTNEPVTVVDLNSLGNTKLVPERSNETEGGIDATLFRGRVNVTATGYYKMRFDAILNVPVAPSVGVGNALDLDGIGQQQKNIGTVRNEGMEFTFSAVPWDSRNVTWSVYASFSENTNTVMRLVPGQGPLVIGGGAGGEYENKVEPGYPLDGLWARPILSYHDANHDGYIEPGEIRVGDSAVFIGHTLPRYEIPFSTDLSLFRGRVHFNTAFDFEEGLTQVNANSPLLLDINNPHPPPLDLQAAVAAYASGQTAYGLVQTVNVLRWSSLSVSYVVPPNITRVLHTPNLSIAFQASNLALVTNYRGKDPGVNVFANGNLTADSGQLPQPRTYGIRISMGN